MSPSGLKQAVFCDHLSIIVQTQGKESQDHFSKSQHLMTQSIEQLSIYSLDNCYHINNQPRLSTLLQNSLSFLGLNEQHFGKS